MWVKDLPVRKIGPQLGSHPHKTNTLIATQKYVHKTSADGS